MSQSVKIEGSLLAKNTILNFIGQVIPLLVAVATIPYVIRGLGVERFGILSLAWVVLGYFSLFDFGLGRATTKFVAEELGKGEIGRIPTIVWTSLGIISVLGFVGGAILFALTPLLVEHVLNVPTSLIDETKLVFYISSVSILITLVSATLSGVLQAYQRFDLVNALKIFSSISSSIIPVIAIYLGAGLPAIVLFLAMKNVGMVFIYFLFCMKLMPKGKLFSSNLKLVTSLFSFGGWITVIAVASLVVTQLNYFLIGSRLSISDVAYYTPPYRIANYLWILPTSFFMTLFPAFSVIGRSHKDDLERLFASSLKLLLLLIGPIVLMSVLFSREILYLWLGSEFAERSTLALQILLIGFFLNSQAWIPSTLLQGIGRPDVVGKIFLLELPLYVATAWWLIGKMGIEGAALAWTSRAGFEFILFFIVCWKIVSLRFSAFAQNGIIRAIIVLGGLILTTSVTRLLFNTTWMLYATITIGFIGVYLLIVWWYVLDGSERSAVKVTLFGGIGRIWVAK